VAKQVDLPGVANCLEVGHIAQVDRMVVGKSSEGLADSPIVGNIAAVGQVGIQKLFVYSLVLLQYPGDTVVVVGILFVWGERESSREAERAADPVDIDCRMGSILLD